VVQVVASFIHDAVLRQNAILYGIHDAKPRQEDISSSCAAFATTKYGLRLQQQCAYFVGGGDE
jgi:hypothetical protein